MFGTAEQRQAVIEKKSPAGLPVGDGKRIFEAATFLEFITPTLLRLDALTADPLLAPQGASFVGGE